MSENRKVLLNLSGGSDSVYCLYWHIQNRPEIPLVIHHIVLKNEWISKWKLENKAVEGCMNWVRKQGFTNYKYYESEYKRPVSQAFPEMFAIQFLTAMLCVKFPEIDEIYLPANKNDVGRNLHKLRVSYIRNELFHLLIDDRKRSEKILFNKDVTCHLTKQEILAAIPPELRKHIHFCLAPNTRGSTCLQLKRIKKCTACSESIGEQGCTKYWFNEYGNNPSE